MLRAWPEWTALMELLVSKGYLAGIVVGAASPPSKVFNQIRTACLDFARDRPEFITYFSRRHIQKIAGSGCPSLDRKIVNSGKRLRVYVGLDEGDVCNSCNLRDGCERAYQKADETETGRTVDVMRFLLAHGLNLMTGSVENQICFSQSSKESARSLLKEVLELSAKQLGFKSSTSYNCASNNATSTAHGMLKDQFSGPMKQGDWLCPKCNFLNFAKNIKCLRCEEFCQERLTKLREEYELLPLKKGDWICQKCHFLNFARNTKCMQCKENPTNRQLNPGEWECPSCYFVNFRKNSICLKCDWKRPKASVSAEAVSAPGDGNQTRSKRTCITFVRNEDSSNKYAQIPEEGDTDFWSSEAEEDTGGLDFPISGGRSSISRDPRAREKWKVEMSKRRSDTSSRPRSRETDDDSDIASAMNSEAMGYLSSDDELAEWFRYSGCKDQIK